MRSRFKGNVPVIMQLLLLHKIHGWRPFNLLVDNVTIESFSTKCECNTSVTPPGFLNVHINMLEAVHNRYSHTELYLQSDNGKYDLEVVNRTVDMCRFFRDVTYEPILQVAFKLFKSNSKFFTSCFIKKGSYSIENLKLNVESLPPIFPEKNGFYKHTFFVDKRRILYKFRAFFSFHKVYKKTP
ncbi:hypothetical protein Bhyg_17551, partial [Pseudolycoriella hygida]